MAFADLNRIVIASETRYMIPADLARELRVLPIKQDRQTPRLAMNGPDLDRMAKVKELMGMRVIPVLCLASAFYDALKSF